MRLLKTVRQVVGIEVVFLLIRLVYSSFPCLVDRRQLNKFSFIDIKIVNCSIVMR